MKNKDNKTSNESDEEENIRWENKNKKKAIEKLKYCDIPLYQPI